MVGKKGPTTLVKNMLKGGSVFDEGLYGEDIEG